MVMLELERDPIFRVSDYPDMSRGAIRERAMEKVPRIHQKSMGVSLSPSLPPPLLDPETGSLPAGGQHGRLPEAPVHSLGR